jgi:hypothetical protein
MPFPMVVSTGHAATSPHLPVNRLPNPVTIDKGANFIDAAW